MGCLVEGAVARSPLRSHAFLRLWLGLSISYLGDQFTTIALLWFVLQLTGSGVALIGALFTSFVAARFRPGLSQPLIAILWGGFLCPLMIFHSLSLALLCLALGACSWAPYVPIEASLLQRLIESSRRGQVFGTRLTLTTAAAPLGA
jgi:hypothetical protein